MENNITLHLCTLVLRVCRIVDTYTLKSVRYNLLLSLRSLLPLSNKLLDLKDPSHNHTKFHKLVT